MNNKEEFKMDLKLFDFDEEVEPIVNVLTFKTLEEAGVTEINLAYHVEYDERYAFED